MFHKLKSFILKNKYSLIGAMIILLVSLLNFIYTIMSGEFFLLGENRVIFYTLFVFRVLVYTVLFILIRRHLKDVVRLSIERLLALIVVIYEGIVVFNAPSLLLSALGG